MRLIKLIGIKQICIKKLSDMIIVIELTVKRFHIMDGVNNIIYGFYKMYTPGCFN